MEDLKNARGLYRSALSDLTNLPGKRGVSSDLTDLQGKRVTSGDSTTQPEKGGTLGDLTNLPEKRGSSGSLTYPPEKRGASDDLVFKSGKVDFDGDKPSVKKVRFGVENLVPEKSDLWKNLGSSNDSQFIGSFRGIDDVTDEHVVDFALDSKQSLTFGKEHVSWDTSAKSIQKLDTFLGNESRDSCESAEFLQLRRNQVEDDHQNMPPICNRKIAQCDICGEVSAACKRNVDATDVRVQLPTESGSNECFKSLMESAPQLGLHRCRGMENSEILFCSCAFCVKASYIWSDLLYQDTKGRFSALRKIQKEARRLVHSCGRGKQSIPSGEGRSGQTLKLESELTPLWESFFLSTENILKKESKQLQSDLVAFKELRNRWKIDLEK